MKQNYNIKFLLIPLTVFIIIKALWVLVEITWLPSKGVEFIDKEEIKALYYRVRVDKPRLKKRVKKLKVKKPISRIKDIKLLGLYISSDNIIVTVEFNGNSKILTIGDKINGFTLIGAESTYAILTKKDKNYNIELPKLKTETKSSIEVLRSNKNKKPKHYSAVIESDDGVKVIDKKTLQHFTSNINDVYKNIGIRDVAVGDKKRFEVSFIKRNSVFAKLGLKRGDIIKSINGEEIDSYAKAFSIYREASSMRSLSLILERNNKEVELEYEID